MASPPYLSCPIGPANQRLPRARQYTESRQKVKGKSNESSGTSPPHHPPPPRPRCRRNATGNGPQSYTLLTHFVNPGFPQQPLAEQADVPVTDGLRAGLDPRLSKPDSSTQGSRVDRSSNEPMSAGPAGRGTPASPYLLNPLPPPLVPAPKRLSGKQMCRLPTVSEGRVL